MTDELQAALISVWRQAMVENKARVSVGSQEYKVRRTSRNRLREVDFVVEGREYRGLEQNPETKSHWARLAREGKKVMQFLSGGQYVANVAEGEVFEYGRR